MVFPVSQIPSHNILPITAVLESPWCMSDCPQHQGYSQGKLTFGKLPRQRCLWRDFRSRNTAFANLWTNPSALGQLSHPACTLVCIYACITLSVNTHTNQKQKSVFTHTYPGVNSQRVTLKSKV